MRDWIQSWWNSSSSPSNATKDTSSQTAVNPLNPQGLKPCCACPETKSARDECFLKNSAEDADDKCKDLVRAHKECMLSYGFKV